MNRLWVARFFRILGLGLLLGLALVNFERSWRQEKNDWFKQTPYEFHAPQGVVGSPIRRDGLLIDSLAWPLPPGDPIQTEFVFRRREDKGFSLHLIGADQKATVRFSPEHHPDAWSRDRLRFVLFGDAGRVSLLFDGQVVDEVAQPVRAFSSIVLENEAATSALQAIRWRGAPGHRGGVRFALFPSAACVPLLALAAVAMVLTALAAYRRYRAPRLVIWERPLLVVNLALVPFAVGGLFPQTGSALRAYALLAVLSAFLLSWPRVFAALTRAVRPAKVAVILLGVAWAVAVVWLWHAPPVTHGAFAAVLFTLSVIVLVRAWPHRDQLRAFPLWVLLLTCNVAVCAEMAARHSALETRWQPMNVGREFVAHKDLLFVPKELFQGHDADYVLGPLRFRGRSAPQAGNPQVFRVIVMGGSNAWGDHLASSEPTFSNQLERLLNERLGPRRFEVLNAGVKGLGLFRILVLLQREVAAYRPNLVILYINYNDGKDFLGPYTLRELLRFQQEKRWSEIESQIRSAGAPSGPPPWVRATQDTLRRVRLYNGLTSLIVDLRGREMKNVAERLGVLRPVNPLTDYRQNLRDVIAFCREHGIRLLLVDEFTYLDAGTDVTSAGWLQSKPHLVRVAMREEATQAGAAYLPLHEEFNQRADKASLVFDFDPIHLNENGHQQVAERLAEFLTASRLLDPPPAER
jgi:lysophospholipase L1-like esterase